VNECVTTVAYSQAFFLAVNDGYVGWTQKAMNGAVESAPKAGGAIDVLSVGSSGGGIAMDATNVYWSSSTDLLSIPVSGGATVTVASAPQSLSLAVDSTNLYWMDQTDLAVMRVPKVGGTPVTIATVPPPSGGGYVRYALAIDANSVYFTTDTDVRSVPLGGGAVSTLATGLQSPLGGIAVGPSAVCFMVIPAVLCVPPAGGSVTTVASGGEIGSGVIQPGRIAVDDRNVYWAEGQEIAKASLAGGGTVILSGQLHDVAAIAVDSTSVYWSSLVMGTISRITPK